MQILITGIVLAASTLAGATGASAQEPEKKVLTLDGDRTLVIVLIKPDKTADFEAVLSKYQQALEKSDKPVRKQQLEGMKFFKSPTPMGGNAAYIISVDPVIKGEEYDITRVINEVFPSEALDIYNKYKDSFAGRQIIPLNKLQ
jgi:hypothetical protein